MASKKMLKLLTEKERQKVASEYIVRRAVVVISGLILVLLIGIVGLLPSYVLSNARQNEALALTKSMDGVENREDESGLQAWLIKINKKLALLSPKLDVDRPSNFIERVNEQSIKGVRLTDFSWTKVAGKINLSVGGVAQDRQTLIMFENNINSSQHFSEVTLPISNLVKDKDIDFQIKFSPL